MEGDHRYPSEWVVGESAEKLSHVKLVFAVKQSNKEKLKEKFLSVSDPMSPEYGKHWTLEQIHALVRPSDEALNSVNQWLTQFKDITITDRNDFIIVDTNVQTAESMLQCKYHIWTHKKNQNVKLLRSATPYSLPSEVAVHVDFVGGVRHFPKLRKLIVNNKRNAQQDLQVTPRMLKDRYLIGDAVGKSSNNSQAVAQFLGQYFSEADLQEFFILLLQSAVGDAPTIVGPNDLIAGVEASLDIEYIMSTGQSIPTTFWSTDGLHDEQEPFLQWLIDIDNTTKPPFLFSVSYGDDEDSLTTDYVYRIDQEFQKQGLRGISFLFASGDDGVGGDFEGCTAFVPNYPASSPYVTAVGGTTLDGWFETGKEIVNSLSGGGFSNYESSPSYQKAAVENYLKIATDLPPQNLWNKTGRAYPDIAALSANFVVVVNFTPLPGVAGTSCAAPTISGIIGLLNDLRLSAGKPPLGFLNILLYQLGQTQPQVFTDITDGSNPGCGTDGFSAAKGWDPSTGFGSINYAEFAKIILNF
jgi:tripeptidyl-peptidase-1